LKKNSLPTYATGFINRRTFTVILAAALALLFSRSAPAWADGGPDCTHKCGITCDAIANGPFTYSDESGPLSATFFGTDGSPVSFSFTVTAPDATGNIIVFPGEGQNPCTGTADATIGVLEIDQVVDASGNPISPPSQLDSSSALYAQIAGAFAIVPNGDTFSPGSSVPVSVTVSNPDVDSSNFGEYMVKLAAQAPGAGIGVGPGFEFDLTLKASECAADTTPCVVTISAPTSAPQTLGPIAVSVSAYDPNPSTTCPGSGLASLTASISSAGGAVSNVNIPLTLSSTLPLAGGVVMTGSGSYTPTGGTGGSGTSLSSAFTAASRSGIGTYTITATCNDIAGNPGTASVTFPVNYAVSWTQEQVPGGCTSTKTKPCQAMFKFDVDRSSATSDGAFMYDETVKVTLVSSANSSSNSCTNSSLAIASHPFGTGSINSNTQIDPTVPDYQTNFDGSNTSTVPFGSYVAQACFSDVDGNPNLQGTSPSVNF